MKEILTTKYAKHTKVEFCNEGDKSTAVVAVGFENELTIGEDGWAQIAPYGDFLGVAVIRKDDGTYKKEMAIQRMDRAAVAQMVNEYQQSRRGIKKFFKARPLFLGHPDAPGGGAKYPDKSPKGVFANLAERDNGFFGEPILTEDGEKIVASPKPIFLSGRWDAEPTDETVERGGQTLRVFRPVKFLSAGLTNTPRLPVQMMNSTDLDDLADASAAADSDTNKNTTMKKRLAAVLKKYGITLANDATDEQAEAAIGQLETKVDGLVTISNEHETLKTSDAGKDGKITNLTTERDGLKTQFANERKARIDREIALALTSGRITGEQKADWERRLGTEASFANELEALNKLTPTVKTESVTIQRGDRKVELANAGERADMVNELCDEIAREKNWDRKRDHSKIFNEVQRRHPALFKTMKQPGSK